MYYDDEVADARYAAAPAPTRRERQHLDAVDDATDGAFDRYEERFRHVVEPDGHNEQDQEKRRNEDADKRPYHPFSGFYQENEGEDDYDYGNW